ncbi:putative mitochondrial hypothetical protein [Leptomonas pyrrhocoris]|uniref:Uncharacterized protein n=1 Tax=Leptomonas pyrrhocoris TaxID=157538 RepID=A0A0M9FVQ9_LEPPY|nr:putative mitochondrial hypothetical protein [Leptomonas pyrrhocoris]KPA77070.1 putative mitochondrial hypothetical protein [Leptomonas pyrrhocoris]|eukprot:XP_015655509.1 putative mitochondrial hypothetical protein [Leptomonas pyrrhocoris]
MSKSISVIAVAAPAALLQAASAIVSKATGGAVKVTQTAAATANAVVVGTAAPPGVYACVAEPTSATIGLYAGVQTVVVRAILPRGAPDTMQVRDILDVYPASGIACDAEVAKAEENIKKAAKVAVEKAKALKATRVTLVMKPASKYTRLNALFRESAAKVIEGAGLSVEVTTTAQASNDLVMFPEKHGVVMVNDDPVCEKVQFAYAGEVGGVHTTYYTDAGGKIHGGHSYKSVATALAEELKSLGLKAEAARIEAAAQKDPRNVVDAI